MGGFSAGEFGPMRGLPTDMGMLQAGTFARGGNSAADLRVQGNFVRKISKTTTLSVRIGTAIIRARGRPAPLERLVGATWDEINELFGGGWDAFPY